jgi:cytochrome c
METYVQAPSSASTEQNAVSCFSCHNDNNGIKPSDLSHVFEDIISLPPNTDNKRILKE